MSELDAAVELLERALAYTRVALADVRPDLVPGLLARRTPCDGWDLERLLSHMEDSLDAFTEAASGFVAIDPLPAADPGLGLVGVLRDKACTLLGAWTTRRGVGLSTAIRVGDLELAGSVLVATAALEITVHGWDVGQTTGRGGAIPEQLAKALLGVATHVLSPQDRAGRFGAARGVAAIAHNEAQLLAFLGRVPSSHFGGDLLRGVLPPGVAS